MTDIFIVEAKRSAIGAFGGSLKEVSPSDLGAELVKSMLPESLADDAIDECFIGNVLGAGHGMNIARQVQLKAGIAVTAPASTINNVCGSGLKAVCLGANSILSGENHLVLAGGLESMSQAAFVNMQQRWGQKMGPVQMQDLMVHDGLTDAFGSCHMGITAENLAEKYSISREEQDAFAFASQQKAARALAEGAFQSEIVPIALLKRGKKIGDFLEDEYIRKDASLEALSGLRAVFKSDGTVTAGNASGINDGAAFLLLASKEALSTYGLTPIAKIEGYRSAGVAPDIMGIGPVAATQKLCEHLDCTADSFDAIESNEAFAVQAIAVQRELKLPEERVNTRGGAIALGHPIGASGARILVTLLHRLQAGEGTRGLATLCVGGGQGVALSVTTKV